MNDSNPASAADTDFAAKAAQLKCLFEELCSGAPDAVKDAACQAKAKAIAAGRKAVDTVRRHPVETTIIAIGAGLLVWWLMTRKQHDD